MLELIYSNYVNLFIRLLTCTAQMKYTYYKLAAEPVHERVVFG